MAPTEILSEQHFRKFREWLEVLGVRKGDIVTPNQPVIRALSSEDRWVKIFVPETELGKIRRESTPNFRSRRQARNVPAVVSRLICGLTANLLRLKLRLTVVAWMESWQSQPNPATE